MAKNNNRDNFLETTIAVLRKRVNDRCSNPECRVPLSGPATEKEKAIHVGIAAHICAAAPKGPRYLAVMTPDQRKHIDNAIWLCAPCSIMIDKDEHKYSVAHLHSWKAEAERLATKEMGQKLPRKDDAIKTVTAALTGLPTSFLPQAIENVCRASSLALEALDPRFKIRTSYKDGHTNFEIAAQEKTVSFKFQVKDEFKQEFADKFKGFLAHGSALEIASEAITLTGSKLLEEIFAISSKGSFKMNPAMKKKAVQKIWLTKEGEVSILNDVVGDIVVGRDTYTITGCGYDGLLEIAYRQNHNKMGEPAKLTITLNFRNWAHQPLSSLPSFEALYSFFLQLIEGWSFNTRVEIEGNDFFVGKGANLQREECIRTIFYPLRYVFLARKVLEYLEIEEDVVFDPDFDYPKSTYDLLVEIYRIISGEGVCMASQASSNASCVLIAADDLSNISALANRDEPRAIKMDQGVLYEVVLFSSRVQMPRISHTITHVIPKFSQDVATITPGQEVHIEWIPTEECQIVSSIF